MVAWQVPWMVVSHEYGHYRVADREGWDPEVHITGWMSGFTRYTFPEGARPTNQQRLEASAAGVNQQQLNALYSYRNWAVNGGVRYQEALGFLLAETNVALYALNSLRKGDDTPSSDDIASYVSRLRSAGNDDISTGKIAAMAVAADLCSAPFWAALIGTGRFVATGERRIAIPTFNIGSTEVTYPNFHLLLDSAGPIMGGSMFVNPEGPTPPIELRVDVRSDGSGGAFSSTAHGIELGLSGLRLTPSAGFSYDALRGPGFMAGVNLEYDFSRYLGAYAGVTYYQNFMLDEVSGREDGFHAGGGLVGHF